MFTGPATMVLPVKSTGSGALNMTPSIQIEKALSYASVVPSALVASSIVSPALLSQFPENGAPVSVPPVLVANQLVLPIPGVIPRGSDAGAAEAVSEMMNADKNIGIAILIVFMNCSPYVKPNIYA